MSFLKYQEDQGLRRGNGRGPLYFSRAHLDGMPWRGDPVLLKEDEFSELTEQVNDFDVGLYDIRDPDQYKELKVIFDRAANEWYQILDYDKKWVNNQDGSHTVLVYVMYAVPHREFAKGRGDATLGASPIPEHPAPWRHGGQ